MKKIVLCSIMGVLVLSSCQKSDLYHGPQQPENTNTPQDNKAKAESVLGFEIPADQDWCLTDNGQVTLNVDATVKKVQLLVYDTEVVDDVPDYVTKTGLSMLNQAETNGRSSITMTYDAPKSKLALYAAFITDEHFYLQKVEGNTVTFQPGTARTRGQHGTRGVSLPSTVPTITKAVESYASQRGWNSGELLYEYDNYASFKMISDDYSKDFKDGFNVYVTSLLPNGRKDAYGNPINNLVSYRTGLGYVDVYGTTKANEPVIITPVYKYDQPTKWGYEVYMSELYYYYYKEENIPSGTSETDYIKSLPKYKALNFSDCFGKTEDGVIKNHGSYALIYYGDGAPIIENGVYKTTATPSYYFPEGYKIGFMVRANTDSEGEKKQGEVYADGLQNKDINNYPNFKSSNLEDTDQRAVWLDLDGTWLLCWESGTDSDFNDIVLEVTGLGGIIPPPVIKAQKYVFCFEDTKDNGDYDLNDLVVMGERTNENVVTYTILACGAYDEIEVLNIGAPETEVHKLFGVDNPKTYINTVHGETAYTNYPTYKKDVDDKFSFLDPNNQPVLVDITTHSSVSVSTVGEAPFGIMIPSKDGFQFRYPREKTCIKTAYTGFGKWGKNPVTFTDWYKCPVSDTVY